MSEFIEFILDDGTVLAVEAFAPLPPATGTGERAETGEGEPIPGFGGTRPVARGRRVVAAAEGTLRTLLSPMVPFLQQVHDTVVAVPDAPDEVSVAFGVRISQDLKMGIVGAGGEATMTVTAHWRPGAGAPEGTPGADAR